jgi:hypothetical protein
MTTGKLSVTVSVDLDSSVVSIRPVGTLTIRNVQGLLALQRRAERALPHCDVVIDGGLLAYESAEALEALRDSGLLPKHSRIGSVGQAFLPPVSRAA